MIERPLEILGITGSLREGSYNTLLLESCRRIFPEGTNFEVVTCRDIPLYEAALDGESKPPTVEAFCKAIAAADAVLFATPEYNYSVPGGLKNAIDWASRPAFRAPLTKKPTGILSASAAVTGGARAQGHLKQILLATLSPIFPSPEVLVGEAGKKFGPDGKLTDEKVLASVERYVNGFAEWVLRVRGAA